MLQGGDFTIFDFPVDTEADPPVANLRVKSRTSAVQPGDWLTGEPMDEDDLFFMLQITMTALERLRQIRQRRERGH
jgi:hypothetical protein